MSFTTVLLRMLGELLILGSAFFIVALLLTLPAIGVTAAIFGESFSLWPFLGMGAVCLFVMAIGIWLTKME